MMPTPAQDAVELSQDPLPARGNLRANLVRLFDIKLGDPKWAVLGVGMANNFLVEDDTDTAFDVVYFYRDQAAMQADVNLAAYRIRDGVVEAISVFGRLPRSTQAVPRFETVAPSPLRELLQACADQGIRERILGRPVHDSVGGRPPERIETYRYDGGRIELEYTLFHFQHPSPSTSETCRLTFQREAP